jgi:hypothetical protein
LDLERRRQGLEALLQPWRQGAVPLQVFLQARGELAAPLALGFPCTSIGVANRITASGLEGMTARLYRMGTSSPLYMGRRSPAPYA